MNETIFLDEEWLGGIIKKYPSIPEKQIREHAERWLKYFKENPYTFTEYEKFAYNHQIKERIRYINTKYEEEKDLSQENERIELGKIYEEIITAFDEYCDIPKKYSQLMALWCIGAVHIQKFNTYPYLFINAMRGSGKTRILKLLMRLCGGDVLNSPTEAVLFRSNTPLGIDEFEGIGRRGNENIRELLNSAYKKDIKVKRMRKVKAHDGEKQIVEEFMVFRAIAMANIWGMEDVLGDRCIQIVVDKSNKPVVTKKIEIFEPFSEIQCRLCRVVSCFNVYNDIILGWNDYISHTYNDTNNITTQTTLTTLTTLQDKYLMFFNKIKESNLDGRMLELSFPILFIASILNEKIFDEILKTFREIDEQRREEDISENYDVSLIDFVSQEIETDFFIPTKEITDKFKEFLHTNEEWINEKWVGRALKRLNLIKQKKRKSRGREFVLDYKKAQEKIRMFK